MKRFHVMSSEYSEVWTLDCLASDEQSAILNLAMSFPKQRFTKPFAIDIDNDKFQNRDIMKRLQEQWKDGRKVYIPEPSYF